jgi:acetyl esterase/lipase
LLILILAFAVPGLAAEDAAALPEGVKRVSDIVYAKVAGVELHMDIGLPEKASDKPLPVVVWIHGGGWKTGTYKWLRSAWLVKHGYAAVSIQYRFLDEAKFPAQIYDCKAAIRFLRANASKYGIDPNRIGVWGGSAGGHLAALLGTSGGAKELEGDEGNAGLSSGVQAVCEWYGPNDFTVGDHEPEPGRKKPPLLVQLFGATLKDKPELYRLGSPITHVSKDDPPFLIVHGDADELVPFSQAQSFCEALHKAGVEATLVKVRGGNHGLTAKGMQPGMQEIERQMVEFFDRHLKREQQAVPIPPHMVFPPSNEGINIPYARVGDRNLYINLILPKEKCAKPLPVIVWIHGGGWAAGDYTRSRAAEFAKHGYAAASVEYRFTDAAPLPAQVFDCKAAVRFLRANAKTYNLDPDRIGVWGGSAGGHLAAMLGTSGGVKELEGDEGNLSQSSRVQCVCPWFGLYDMTSGFIKKPKPGQPEPVLDYLGGTYSEKLDLVKLVSPVTHITKNDPPFLIVHGDLDKTIPVKQAELLDDALRKAGVETTFIRVKGGDHNFTKPDTQPSMQEVAKAMLEFFDKHLK